MIRKIIEKLFWHYQEKDNWEMKMNEPIAIKKLTKEEAQDFLMKQRAKKISDHKMPSTFEGYIFLYN